MKRIDYILRNIAHYSSEVLAIIDKWHSTMWLYICAAWWRVALKKQSHARGKVYFCRRQDSTIKIGHGCMFLSRQTANKMGLFCPCMLSTLTSKAEIIIGNGCGFSGTRILSSVRVQLGNNVRCGANTLITDTNGHSNESRAGDDAPVIIDDNVWLGANVMVMKGVHVGRGAIIGANSVIRTNVPPYAITMGNPAKIVGFVYTPEQILQQEESYYPPEERIGMGVLAQNYQKYFLDRLDEIKKITRI